MDEHGGDFAAFPCQGRELVAGNGEDFDGFEGDHVSRGSDEPRIGQHAGNLACMPFEEFAGAGTAIDEQSESPREDDIEVLDLATLSAHQLARI